MKNKEFIMEKKILNIETIERVKEVKVASKAITNQNHMLKWLKIEMILKREQTK